ncbi:MAG: Gfo/Idh/MocA family oxidoreductase [Anaerolineae bacterium]|nr:MAG: Gfo/Idh/MocA family oxidoreductase [Anaerolineae bacterium]
MTELGIGLIGCGRWGQILARAIQGLDGARMAAVQNRTLSTAQEFGASMGVPAYATFQELLADPNVEAVLVANPHSLHEEVAVAAAEAGKHIFCDKPLAIDVAACYRMIDATEKHGVKMMCGQVTRLYPVYRRAAEVVKSGRLGQLAAVNVADMVHIDRVRWWARSGTMGALLHSPGVHAIDYLLSVCGRATSVSAFESRVRVQPGVDYQDSLFLLVVFESGAIGGVECSVSCLTPDRRCHMIGTQGSLRFDPTESWIEVASWKGEQERIEVGPSDRRGRLNVGVNAELESFIKWVTLDAEPILTAWDGLRAVEIIDAAYQSIAQRRAIDLPLPRP